jgi:hypothetical protein
MISRAFISLAIGQRHGSRNAYQIGLSCCRFWQSTYELVWPSLQAFCLAALFGASPRVRGIPHKKQRGTCRCPTSCHDGTVMLAAELHSGLLPTVCIAPKCGFSPHLASRPISLQSIKAQGSYPRKFVWRLTRLPRRLHVKLQLLVQSSQQHSPYLTYPRSAPNCRSSVLSQWHHCFT